MDIVMSDNMPKGMTIEYPNYDAVYVLFTDGEDKYISLKDYRWFRKKHGEPHKFSSKEYKKLYGDSE